MQGEYLSLLDLYPHREGEYSRKFALLVLSGRELGPLNINTVNLVAAKLGDSRGVLIDAPKEVVSYKIRIPFQPGPEAKIFISADGRDIIKPRTLDVTLWDADGREVISNGYWHGAAVDDLKRAMDAKSNMI